MTASPARKRRGVTKIRPGPKQSARKPAGKAGSNAPDVIKLPAPVVDSGLTSREIAEFRELLLAKRAQLIGDVTHLHNEAMRNNRQEASGDLSSMPIHMADIGTDNYEQEFTLGLIEGERAILRDIEEALLRIENGTYGLCLATGQPIGKARLRANPWAKYCYEYTLAQEKGRTRRF